MSSNMSSFTPPLDISRSPSPAPIFKGTLFFGYGSNLWQHQVALRCPNAKFVGIARLRHWRWQINERGYANVVEAPKVPHDPSLARWLGPLMSHNPDETDLRDDNLRTYGMVYELSDEDIKNLDQFEDCPSSYTKEEAFVELWYRREGQKGKMNILRRGKRVKVMFYCDRNNTTDSRDTIFRAYSYKMNQGIMDALEEGIPRGYIDECLRPFVPNVDDSGVKGAIQDAMMMGIDIKKLVEKIEDELAVTTVKSDTNVAVSKESLQNYIKSMIPEADGNRSSSQDTKDFSRRRALSSRW